MTAGIGDLFSFLEGGFSNIVVDTYTPIVFPLSFPVGVGVKEIVWKYTSANRKSQSQYSYSSQIQKFGGQLLSADVTFAMCNARQVGELEAFLMMLDGENGTFLMGDSVRKSPLGLNLGEPVISGANQTGNTLITRAWTSNVVGQLKAGDWISFPDNRLHKVARDITSDGSGKCYLDIYPRLRALYPDGTPITTQNAQGTFRLTSSGYDISDADESKKYQVSFACEEAI